MVPNMVNKAIESSAVQNLVSLMFAVGSNNTNRQRFLRHQIANNHPQKRYFEVKKDQGAILIFAAAILWSFAGLAAKYISWNAMSIACIRGVIGAITIGSITKQWFFRPTKAVWLGAFGTVTTSILFMTANKLTTAANAIVLQYLAPAVVIGLNATFLKQKPKKIDVIMVGLTIFGIVLFFVDHLGSGAILGDVLAMLSSMTFALVFFANRLPGANAFQSSYLGCALHIFLLPSIFEDEAFALYNPIMIVVIVLMGVVQMGFAYIFFAKGIAKTTSVTASIIATIEPILNPIWVFLVYGEKPTIIALLGAAIVIVSITAYNILISKTMEESGRIDMRKNEDEQRMASHNKLPCTKARENRLQ